MSATESPDTDPTRFLDARVFWKKALLASPPKGWIFQGGPCFH